MLGIDIVEISRIKKLIEEKENFLSKVFTEDEIERIKKRKEPHERASGIFAAKEAVAKALGTGLGKISFKDIKIKYQGDAPYAEVFDMKLDLSISHERDYAVAVAKVRGDNFMEKNHEEEIILDEEMISL